MRGVGIWADAATEAILAYRPRLLDGSWLSRWEGNPSQLASGHVLQEAGQKEAAGECKQSSQADEGKRTAARYAPGRIAAQVQAAYRSVLSS